jgi:hypothetical protein
MAAGKVERMQESVAAAEQGPTEVLGGTQIQRMTKLVVPPRVLPFPTSSRSRPFNQDRSQTRWSNTELGQSTSVCIFVQSMKRA